MEQKTCKCGQKALPKRDECSGCASDRRFNEMFERGKKEKEKRDKKP